MSEDADSAATRGAAEQADRAPGLGLDRG